MICVIVLLPCYLNLSGQMKTRIFLFNKQVDKKAWLWKEQSDLFGPAQKKNPWTLPLFSEFRSTLLHILALQYDISIHHAIIHLSVTSLMK